MLPKCIVFNGVAVFKTPACAKKDRIVQFSEIHHNYYNSNSTKWPSSGLKKTRIDRVIVWNRLGELRNH